MRAAALLAIRLYQRWLSPRKGFLCPYRLQTGRASCSALGYRAIRRWGIFAGWGVLRLRFSECARANPVRLARPRLTLSPQAGSCDVPACDCDLPSIDLPDCNLDKWGCDLLSGLGDCGGGGGGRRKRSVNVVDQAPPLG